MLFIVKLYLQVGRLYEHNCKLCYYKTLIAHFLFECPEIENFRNMQWQLMEVPNSLKESLIEMPTQHRSTVMCNALNIKYEKD